MFQEERSAWRRETNWEGAGLEDRIPIRRWCSNPDARKLSLTRA